MRDWEDLVPIAARNVVTLKENGSQCSDWFHDTPGTQALVDEELENSLYPDGDLHVE